MACWSVLRPRHGSHGVHWVRVVSPFPTPSPPPRNGPQWVRWVPVWVRQGVASGTTPSARHALHGVRWVLYIGCGEVQLSLSRVASRSQRAIAASAALNGGVAQAQQGFQGPRGAHGASEGRTARVCDNCNTQPSLRPLIPSRAFAGPQGRVVSLWLRRRDGGL